MKHLIPEFDRLKRRYPPGAESSLVLPCLHRIQDDRGFIADEDIAALTEYLGVARVQIEEVVAHYSMFRRQPVGRWHLQACRNVSCSMRGAEGLIDHLCKRLGVLPGQTTADGRITLEFAECIGACDGAPAVLLNLEESAAPAAQAPGARAPCERAPRGAAPRPPHHSRAPTAAPRPRATGRAGGVAEYGWDASAGTSSCCCCPGRATIPAPATSPASASMPSPPPSSCPTGTPRWD